MTSALFIGDHLAADFLNTRAGVGDKTREHIADGDAFVGWLADASALSRKQAQAALERFPATQLDEVAEQARELREWARALLDRWSTRPGPAVIAELRKQLQPLLDLCPYKRTLVANSTSNSGCELQWMPAIEQPQALLGLVAGAIADLVASESPSSFKRCHGHDCSLCFVDRTRSQRRVYCSAALCGNRAKVAAFRARRSRAGQE